MDSFNLCYTFIKSHGSHYVVQVNIFPVWRESSCLRVSWATRTIATFPDFQLKGTLGNFPFKRLWFSGNQWQLMKERQLYWVLRQPLPGKSGRLTEPLHIALLSRSTLGLHILKYQDILQGNSSSPIWTLEVKVFSNWHLWLSVLLCQCHQKQTVQRVVTNCYPLIQLASLTILSSW